MRGLLAVLVILTTTGADQAGPTFGSPWVFTEKGGEAIYRSVCAGCHMPDGRGADGAGAYPSLAEDPRLAASGYFVSVVLHGQRAMPAFGRSLTDEQVAAVVGYVRTHFGNGFSDAPGAADVAAMR